MKIIVCGAGSVGRSIVSYLMKGNNDIVVIDNNQQILNELSQEFDIQPVLGSSSHPEVLEKADAKNAELIIAVTNDDEVNMVTCVVANALFNIPRKIARIDSQDFLEPIWATLYNEKGVPADLIISPEVEIGKYIYQLLKVPGASEVLPLLQKRVILLAFKLNSDCPLIKTPLLQLKQLAPDLNVEIICINRNNKIFIPYKSDVLEVGDEVYILTPTEDKDIAISSFGFEHPSIERVIIFGGNKISRYMAKMFEKDDSILNCKIVEEDIKNAKDLAKDLNNTVVIQGSQMSDKILAEANLSSADVAIAVTMKDKDNLLATMLAQKNGVCNTVALVNSPSYTNLIDIVGDNILVDRSAVTISSILQELRKTEVLNASALGRGFGEVWEMEIGINSQFANRKIKELDLPASSKVCAILRGEELIFPNLQEYLKPHDVMILYVDSQAIRKVEKILA